MSIAISNRSLTIGCLGKLLNDFFAFRFARRVFSFESDNTNQNPAENPGDNTNQTPTENPDEDTNQNQTEADTQGNPADTNGNPTEGVQ